MPQGSGGVQVLERCRTAADDLLGRANDTLQSVLVPDSGSNVADGDEGQ